MSKIWSPGAPRRAFPQNHIFSKFPKNIVQVAPSFGVKKMTSQGKTRDFWKIFGLSGKTVLYLLWVIRLGFIRLQFIRIIRHLDSLELKLTSVQYGNQVCDRSDVIGFQCSDNVVFIPVYSMVYIKCSCNITSVVMIL